MITVAAKDRKKKPRLSLQAYRIYLEAIKPFTQKKPRFMDWLTNERQMDEDESAHAKGVFSFAGFEHQRSISEAFDSDEYHTIVACGTAQWGKTTAMMNIMSYLMLHMPENILKVVPTEKAMRAFADEKFAKVIKSNPQLNAIIGRQDVSITGRKKASIQMRKIPFRNKMLNLATARSSSDLAAKSVPYAFLDDTARFPDNVDGQGSPLEMIEARQKTFPNAFTFMASTPTHKTCNIWEHYKRGTQTQMAVKCLNCRKPHVPDWFADFKIDKNEDDELIPETVRYVCPHCGHKHEDGADKMMLISRSNIVWQNKNDKPKDGVYSCLISDLTTNFYSWTHIADKFSKIQGQPELEQAFYNLILGLPYTDAEFDIKPSTLRVLLVDNTDDIQQHIIAYTIGVDVQGDRFEYEIVGWTKNENPIGIKYAKIYTDTSNIANWYTELGESIVSDAKQFCSGKMRAVFIDSGGHRTTECYQYCANPISNKFITMACKGVPDRPDNPLMRISLPPSVKDQIKRGQHERKCNLILHNQGTVKLIIYKSLANSLKVNKANKPQKNALTSEITKTIKKSTITRYNVFRKKAGYNDTYFKGLVSEERVSVMRAGRIRKIWQVKDRKIRNEPLDCRVLAYLAMKHSVKQKEILNK